MILRRAVFSYFHIFDRCVQQCAVVKSLTCCFPYGLTLETTHPLDPDLSLPSPFDHALEQFERVKPVGIQVRVGDTDRFIDRRPDVILEKGTSIGHGNG